MTDAPLPASTTALRVLSQSASALARADGLDASLGQLLEAALVASQASKAAILVQDPDLVELELAASAGIPDASATAVIGLAGGSGALAEAASRPEAQLDVARIGADGVSRRVSLVPLVVRHDGIERRVGMLVLADIARPLDADGRAMVQALADVAAAAVDRAQLRSVAVERAEWFERVAASDPLTGLANRHVLGRVLDHELTRAGRHGTEVSVAVFDVDAFRDINADQGHEAGDQVLREVAAAISGTVRIIDTVARFGGDEFVVVAPGSAGLIVARRVMATVAALPAVANRAVSVSAGVARFPIHGATSDELLGAALTALEAARSSGRGALLEAALPASA